MIVTVGSARLARGVTGIMGPPGLKGRGVDAGISGPPGLMEGAGAAKTLKKN
jgi:hypothetical protein